MFFDCAILKSPIIMGHTMKPGGRPDREIILRVAHVNRLLAKLADFFIIVCCSLLLPQIIGPLIGFVYSMIADGMHFGPFKSQSVGKKIFDLEVVNTVRGERASYRDSVIRNSPIALATFFAIIPIWGWIVLFLIGIPLI